MSSHFVQCCVSLMFPCYCAVFQCISTLQFIQFILGKHLGRLCLGGTNDIVTFLNLSFCKQQILSKRIVPDLYSKFKQIYTSVVFSLSLSFLLLINVHASFSISFETGFM